MTSDTVVAIATPPGRGGVGIIRLSGALAYAIALQISNRQKLLPRQAVFCSFYSTNNKLIDQGLILYFKAPHSFTGEDVIEFQAHGSPIVLDMLVHECISYGARLAKPGEFSERAFLNNKMDLAQAEAVADLIAASSQTSARMALQTLQGDFSSRINQLNEQIIYLRLYVEAAIDFPEEEIDFLNDSKVTHLLTSILQQLAEIRAQANQGVLLRDGMSLVIAGRPNAGKSTLINSLATREVAIVTPIPGTTRDVMRERILLDDIPVHVIDTAGLRVSDDLVEQEGIRRAWAELKQADCVLLVVDVNHPEQEHELLKEFKEILAISVPIITVFNKIDTVERSPSIEHQQVFLSAKEGLGIEYLKQLIKRIIGYQPSEGQFSARRRHLVALDEAQKLLLNGQQQLQAHKAGELLAEDLRVAHRILGEITGEFTSDDLLGIIFSSFCIGK